MCQASPKPDKMNWVFCWTCVKYRSRGEYTAVLGCGHYGYSSEAYIFKSTDEFERWILEGNDPTGPEVRV